MKRAGSLKIEQQASYKSTKVDVYRDSEILLKNIKNSKQVKSKQDRSDERWYPKQALVNIQTLESLILAQDER